MVSTTSASIRSSIVSLLRALLWNTRILSVSSLVPRRISSAHWSIADDGHTTSVGPELLACCFSSPATIVAIAWIVCCAEKGEDVNDWTA